MYEKITGVKPKITLDKEGFYNTRENGAFLKTMWKTGAVEGLAHIYLRQFLQGLFDSEGSISPTFPASVAIFWRFGQPTMKY